MYTYAKCRGNNFYNKITNHTSYTIIKRIIFIEWHDASNENIQLAFQKCSTTVSITLWNNKEMLHANYDGIWNE